MIRNAVAATATLIAMAVMAPGARGEPSDTGFFDGLYEDHVARQPGDILFVVVSESAMATHSASRAGGKATDAQAGPGAGWLDFFTGAGFGGELDHSANGRSQRRDMLSARVATTVTGVTPAGNLIIEGERRVMVHRDWQTIRMTGEVRPQDVRPDNSVLSQHVANATIEYEGPDPGEPNGRVGIITRILGWLF